MAAKTILGISPGTRVMGLAVMRRGELIEWNVKAFKEKWSLDKRASILDLIEELCRHYSIGIVGIKKVDPLRSSPELSSLVAEIVAQAQLNSIQVHLYSLSDLDYDKRSVKKRTKAHLSEAVADKHPELRKDYIRERNNRTEYYTKMFEAIAIAERCNK